MVELLGLGEEDLDLQKENHAYRLEKIWNGEKKKQIGIQLLCWIVILLSTSWFFKKLTNCKEVCNNRSLTVVCHDT
ncbi:hypothetical protein ACOSQ2_016737 [Xanthoceras sorbifolium]